MAYCALADVKALTGMLFGDATRPTAEEVLTFVMTTAGELDGVAEAVGYTVPVTAQAAVALMQKYNTFGAAVQAWHAAFTSDDEPARVTYWREAYADFLARLRRGEQNLPSELADSEQDIAFGIAPAVPRDSYWLTGEGLP